MMAHPVFAFHWRVIRVASIDLKRSKPNLSKKKVFRVRSEEKKGMPSQIPARFGGGGGGAGGGSAAARRRLGGGNRRRETVKPQSPATLGSRRSRPGPFRHDRLRSKPNDIS